MKTEFTAATIVSTGAQRRSRYFSKEQAVHPAARRVLLGACIALVLGFAVIAPTHSKNASPAQKGAAVTMHATGTFEVKLTPQPPEDKTDTSLSRMTINKQFHGDLEATSKGQMLTGMASVKGSGGYVAIERVEGTLKGRNGSFILQHTGTMSHGTYQLSVTVVPDSGTGQLEGLTGSMTIIITDGKHSYDFAYTLPEPH
jgi:uncharacterized protein DUF3224